jgi:hypothetical protein
MKNPSPLLILAFAAAIPSLAAAEAGPRCSGADWLKTPHTDPASVTKFIKDGKLDVTAICGAPVAGYVTGNAAVKAAWAGPIDQQIKILDAMNEVYLDVDKQGLAVLGAADAVVGSAVKLGVVARKDGAKPAAPFAEAGSYTVEEAAAAKPAAPADVKAGLSSLLADVPAPVSKPNQKPAPAKDPVAGPGVVAFHKAVFALASGIAKHASSGEVVKRWGLSLTADFAQGDGAFYDQSETSTDQNYRHALAYLTDPRVLPQLDPGLSALVSQRATAVDAAFAAAKKSLKGQSVKATLAAVEHAAKGAEAKPDPKDPAKGSIAADVLAKLQATKEFSQLSSLYDNSSKADAKWLDSEQGKAVAAQLQSMKTDAASAKVVKTAAGSGLEYTIGGQKLTDTGIRVADLATDHEYHDFIASVVATNITTDAKLKVLLATLGGAGAPGTVVSPPLTPTQAEVAKKLPPSDAKVAAPKTAWQTVAAAAPSPGLMDGFFGLFGSKSAMERYRDSQREKAADVASTDGERRQAAQDKFEQSKAALQRKQAADAANIVERAKDPAWKPEDAEAWRKKKTDELAASYAQKVEAARKASLEASGVLTPDQISANQKKAQEAADAQVNAAYADGIADSVKELQTEYKKKGNSRHNAAAQSSTLGKFYDNHLDLVDGYFSAAWPGADRTAPAYGACRGSLWGTVNKKGVFLDPSPENVDSSCVRSNLVKYLKDQLGKGVPSDK